MPKTWKTEEELHVAMEQITECLSSLQRESVEAAIRTESVEVRVLESMFQNTVREVFGRDSPEFTEFGHLYMFGGPLRVGISKAEVVESRLRGRDYMIAICNELIRRLQRKSQEAGLKSSLAVGLTLNPRIHEATKALVDNGHTWEAVFAASKALILYVKELSGRFDLDGVALMRTVFSKNAPILRFNSGQTATDQDEQEGMMHLFEGAVMAIRNPGGHAFPSGPERLAIEYLQLLSMLAYRAEGATKV